MYQMIIRPPAGKTAFDTTYSVSTTAPFLSVSPSSGTLPPTGAVVTVTATSTGLPLGSNTGTVNVTTPGGGTIASVPVSVSLVTLVQPTPKDTPPANALIIPAIAHVDTPTTQFVSDVRKGIWREIEGGPVQIDVYRRNLQNSYIDLLSQKLNGRPAVGDEYRAVIKAELRDLSAALAAAAPRALDRETRAHLADARDQIAKALDPKFAPPAPTTNVLSPFGFDEELNYHSSAYEDFDASECWPDYAIRIHPRKP
jgi:hypothetical protein